MKFKLELTINKPRVDVWLAYIDPENVKNWQPSLVSIEHVNGTPGLPGAVSKLNYEESGREFSLIEKITYRDEPNQYDVLYENEFTDNPVKIFSSNKVAMKRYGSSKQNLNSKRSP